MQSWPSRPARCGRTRRARVELCAQGCVHHRTPAVPATVCCHAHRNGAGLDLLMPRSCPSPTTPTRSRSGGAGSGGWRSGGRLAQGVGGRASPSGPSSGLHGGPTPLGSIAGRQTGLAARWASPSGLAPRRAPCAGWGSGPQTCPRLIPRWRRRRISSRSAALGRRR